MDTYKQWLWTRSNTLLPTTFKATDNANISDNFSEGFTNLWKLLQSITTKKSNGTSQTKFQSDFSEQYQRKEMNRSVSSNSLVHAAFPSYLNTESVHRKPAAYSHRKSSLLDGYEQTLHYLSTSEKQTRLALPKDKKYRNQSNENLIQHSQLPVPVVPPPRFHVPNTLYGYLDEATIKRGLHKVTVGI